jgi:hypothetical protein
MTAEFLSEEEVERLEATVRAISRKFLMSISTCLDGHSNGTPVTGRRLRTDWREIAAARPYSRPLFCPWCERRLSTRGAQLHVPTCAREAGESTADALDKIAAAGLGRIIENRKTLEALELLDRRHLAQEGRGPE